MGDSDADWIGRTFTSTVGWDLLENLVDLDHRMAGSEGERRGAELTRDALDAIGAEDTRLEEFGIQGWTRGDAALEAGDTSQECIALPRSPAGEAAGELVDVGYGLRDEFEAADLEGGVAMAVSNVPDWHDRYVHRREKYYRAVEAGAEAFVYANHVEGGLPPTGSVGTEDDPIGPIPAVGVSKEVGARLARRFEGRRIELRVDCEVHDATSQNVHATLGPDTDRELLVTSHVDAHDISEGAMDNGAGTAMLVELARALADREDDLDVGVHFIAYGAEEVGLLGSEYDAANRDPGEVVAVLNNDGVVRGRDLKLYTNRFDALEDAAGAVADRFDYPLATIPEVGPHSDHWPYVYRGVPGLHAMSETGDEGRGWGHTHADTLDKLESRDLREQAVLLTDLAVELASEDRRIEHADPGRIAAALEEQGAAEGMKFAGDWPFEG